MDAKKCLRCGGSEFRSGETNSVWVPDGLKLFPFQTSVFSIRADMCLGCGTMDFVGDFRKVREMKFKDQ